MADPTAHPLPQYVDPKLARGVLRQEMRGLRGGADLAEAATRILDLRAMPTLRRGARLSEAEIARTVGEVAAMFVAAPTHLHLHDPKPRRALTPSKFYRKVGGSFLDLRREGIAHLVTLRIRLSPRGLLLASGATPYSFLDHAAERLIQRLPEDKPRDPLMTLGRAIHASAPLLAPALRPAYQLPNRALGIPFGEGLLLGEVRMRLAREMSPWGYRVENGGLTPMRVGCINASLIPDGGMVDDAATQCLHFVAKTFVGPRELRPEQRDFLARWSAFAAAHAPAFASDGFQAMHPGAFVREIMDAQEAGLNPAPTVAALEAAYADLLAMFRDPGVLAAMGATGPATREPIPYWLEETDEAKRLVRKADDPVARFLAAKPEVRSGAPWL